jgi:hypothetical protein
MTAERTDAPEPQSLAELFASWGPTKIINPSDEGAFTLLAARYAELLKLIHRHEARLSETATSRDAVLEDAALMACYTWPSSEGPQSEFQKGYALGRNDAAVGIRALKNAAPQVEEGSRPRAGSADASNRSQLQPAESASSSRCVVAPQLLEELLTKHFGGSDNFTWNYIEDTSLKDVDPDLAKRIHEFQRTHERPSRSEQGEKNGI